MPTIQILVLDPDANGYSAKPGPTVIATKLDGGAPRSRADQYYATEQVTVRWTTDIAGYNYLRAFFRTATAYGALPFWVSLILDGADMMMRDIVNVVREIDGETVTVTLGTFDNPFVVGSSVLFRNGVWTGAFVYEGYHAEVVTSQTDNQLQFEDSTIWAALPPYDRPPFGQVIEPYMAWLVPNTFALRQQSGLSYVCEATLEVVPNVIDPAADQTIIDAYMGPS